MGKITRKVEQMHRPEEPVQLAELLVSFVAISEKFLCSFLRTPLLFTTKDLNSFHHSSCSLRVYMSGFENRKNRWQLIAMLKGREGGKFCF